MIPSPTRVGTLRLGKTRSYTSSMNSEPVRLRRLINPLKAAMPINAARHDASAPRSSDPASSVEEEWPICTAGVTVDSSVKNAFEGAG